MRLSVVSDGGRQIGVATTPSGVTALLEDIGVTLETALAACTDPGRRETLAAAVERHASVTNPGLSDSPRRPVPLRAILGIGLNFRDHAADLDAALPAEPVFFTKLSRTAVAHGGPIVLPPESTRVTAEAELALVIGRACWRVSTDEALDHVAGACAILDQTAEDVLQRNPRFLTRAKNWPTFFVVGDELVTLDELTAERDLADVTITTRLNGEVGSQAPVSRMIFSPAEVVSFVSHVVPLAPGDVVSTGTPGAVVLADGDRVEGHIEGLGTVTAPVRRPTPEGYGREALAALEQDGLTPY